MIQMKEKEKEEEDVEDLTTLDNFYSNELVQTRLPLIGLDTQQSDVLRFLKDVTDSAESGNSLLIVGAHGSGKTTLIEQALESIVPRKKQSSQQSKDTSMQHTYSSSSSSSSSTSIKQLGFSLVHLDGKLILNDISALKEISSQLALRPKDEGFISDTTLKHHQSVVETQDERKEEVEEVEEDEKTEQGNGDDTIHFLQDHHRILARSQLSVSQRAIDALQPMHMQSLTTMNATTLHSSNIGKKRNFAVSSSSSSSSSSASSSASAKRIQSSLGATKRLLRSSRSSGGLYEDAHDQQLLSLSQPQPQLCSTIEQRDRNDEKISKIKIGPLSISKVLEDDQSFSHHHHSRISSHPHSSHLSYEQYLDFIVLTLRTRQTSVVSSARLAQTQESNELSSPTLSQLSSSSSLLLLLLLLLSLHHDQFLL
jgi:energy-coupling factor transporter ATP-binding protein EcfA2